VEQPGQSRGLLKPGLQWKGAGSAVPGSSAPAKRREPLPSNARSQSEFTLDQLKKMAASRGIPVERLVAQMVQQYLKEQGSEGPSGKAPDGEAGPS
jgi:hypothetical protein